MQSAEQGFGGVSGGASYGGGAGGAITVTLLTYHLAALLRHDDILQDVWVRGETANVKRAASGHFYFSIGDEGACLSCVMWRSSAGRSGYLPDAGTEVLVHGRIDVHLARGQYQLVVDDIRPAGAGAQHAALEKLKSRLFAEGLMDPERKRPLPRFPRLVVVVTSASGAVLHDIEATLAAQPFPPQLVLVPAQVQGLGAEESLAAALVQAGAVEGADVIILARGGGSSEDLWTFNTETVARAIAAAPLPVISAVGHETDFTLADLVADHRAPTPTAAAELIAALRGEMAGRLELAASQLRRALTFQTEALRLRWSSLVARGPLAHPELMLEPRRRRLESIEARLEQGLHRQRGAASHRLALAAGRLEAVSPLATLSRGYATVSRLPERTAVRSILEVAGGDAIRVRLADGLLDARVTAVHESPLLTR